MWPRRSPGETVAAAPIPVAEPEGGWADGTYRLRARGLGISPAIAQTSETESTADFKAPTLAITDFDPATGVVKALVTPGTGNAIEGSLVKGVVRLHGGAAPAALTNIASTAFTVNIDGYLAPVTKGEFQVDAKLDLGPTAFFRIVVEAAAE